MENNKNIKIEENEVVKENKKSNLFVNKLDFQTITSYTALSFLTSLLTCLLLFYVILLNI